MAPYLEKICEEKNILLTSVDVADLSVESKNVLGLKSVPTLDFNWVDYDNKEKSFRLLGLRSEENLREAIRDIEYSKRPPIF